MALWKDQAPAKPASGNVPAPSPAEPVRIAPETPASNAAPAASIAPAPSNSATPARAARQISESLIAADLTIEGKIHGTGHVRIAGQFKGDVNVQGNLTIEPGAHLTGGVKADTVIVGGQLDGNIDAASRVELLQTGMLNGELKAGSLIVAAGSRMRGKSEFGWD